MDRKTFGYKLEGIMEMNRRLSYYYDLDRDVLRSDCGCIFHVETCFDPNTGFDWGFRMQRCCDKFNGVPGEVFNTGTEVSDIEGGLDAIFYTFEYGHELPENEVN